MICTSKMLGMCYILCMTRSIVCVASSAWEVRGGDTPHFDAGASLLLSSMSATSATTYMEGENPEEREAPTFSFWV
jgi:hypothetical protein